MTGLLLSATGFALDVCGLIAGFAAGRWQQALWLILAGNALAAVNDFGGRHWLLFAGNVAGVIICGWLLWRNRRRKRAPRAYGAKSRALIAGLVRRAREAARPRPVLRPVPQGLNWGVP
jgi:hypothetical protein